MAVLSVMVAKTTLATEMSQCYALLASVIRGGDYSLPHTELEQKFTLELTFFGVLKNSISRK